MVPQGRPDQVALVAEVAERQGDAEVLLAEGGDDGLEVVALLAAHPELVGLGLGLHAFEAEGLEPMRYGVVCYDEWQAEVIEHPAIEAREAVAAQPAVYEERMVDVVIRVNGEDRAAQRPVLVEVQPAVPAQPAVQAREAWTENVRDGGNRYSLRLDQLAFFIATAGA